MVKFSQLKLRIIILIIIIFVLLFLFDRLGLMKQVKSIITGILKPIETPLVSVGSKIDDFLQYFKSLNNIKRENESLRAELENLVVEHNNLKNELEEIKVLEKEWEFVRKYKYNYVSGKVIGRVPDNLQILIFNKGEQDGLRNGLPAIIADGILVGKITEVDKTTSKILLLTDSHSQVACAIQNNDKTEGIIRGEHGLSIKMGLIPQGKEIKTKQLVVTSGLESYIPAGLVIGQVDKIFQKPGDLFQEASVTPITPYDNIQILTVIVS